MIMLTKLDHTRILVGFEAVKYIEETPDTLIRFLNGESLIVRETLDQVLTLAQAKRRQDSGSDHASRSNSNTSNVVVNTALTQ